MRFNVMTAPKRNSLHWTPGTLTWENIVSWCSGDIPTTKESGGYILGTLKKTTTRHKGKDKDCTGYHRTKMAIVTRDALTLDVDSPDPGFADMVELIFPYKALLHTTFSSTKKAPRYRLIVPLDRAVAPDEYHTAASAVMQQLGEAQFDPGSVQAERYMFVPAAKNPKDFWWQDIDAPVAKADSLLKDFQQDLSSIPAPKPHRNKRNPYEIEGTIGAFNRAYEDWSTLIEEYDLPYELVGEDRWQLAGAVGAAGMGPIQDTQGLVFSHHINDPAYGVACSAFDLARLHLYGDLDEDTPASTPVNRRPSHAAMQKRATEDIRVVQILVGTQFDDDIDDLNDLDDQLWKNGFNLDARTGTPKDDIHNWKLISKNDPVFKLLRFNELTLSTEASGNLPWRKVTKGKESFDKLDRSALAIHIEEEYNFRPSRPYLEDFINKVALERKVNPLKDWLSSLKWDGKPRVEECLPGVIPTDYTRLVARKCLTGAVARIMDPGVKWDHMLVLFGDEGLGKSYWVDLMAKGFSNGLGRINDKDTYIVMQRSWIMLSDEGHSLKKAEFDAQKEFLTRSHDTFRMPYDREAQAHPRHCVIWGTTNDEVFLRRQEGNRRFLIVKCEEKVDFTQLTDYYVDQVWAEALHLYRKGEQLWLTDTESAAAKEEREPFTEEDALTGIVSAYVDTLVPHNWDEMSPEGRISWMQSREDGFNAEGTQTIDRVCSLQIWVEAMGRRRGDHSRVDLLEITSALKRLEGWHALEGSHRIPGYGPQKIFERDEDLI